ncbi:hypothetical protein [Nocardioides sp. AX2bis]|uniref:hypothetical protein n=1 Tax=Nocardioides sp. AX2bis TaxID=2653157 RepID=UPI0012F3296C|nr:hypothetical protein [Nocardioides sp. AX2bis]VXC39521.1 conserved exported hypothetical protein [Nocardioides sp. AX2bis]
MRLRPNRLRPLTAVAVTAVTAAVLAGCSGGDGADAPEEPASESASEPADPAEAAQVLQDAVDATVAARVFTIDGDLDLEIAGQQLQLQTQGSVDYDATVADLLLSIGQGGQTSEAEVKADGSTLWVRAEGEGIPAFPGGATWLQGEASRLTESTTFTPTGLVGAVLVLRGASEAEELGTEEEDGVQVTRYATTFTYDDALAGVEGEEAQVLGSAFSLTGQASSIDLDVEVAVGEDGVLRELDLEIAESDVPASGGYEISLSDVDGEVSPPTPPDPADVATGPEAEALLDQVIV